MKIIISFSPAAEDDLSKIWDYSAKNWGLEKADSYTDEIQDVCLALANGTKHGSPVDILPNFQKYFCGVHVIFFLKKTKRLEVIRILHQKQDAKHHLK